jgi:hypothetical protein
MNPTDSLTAAERFFYENAGTSYNPKTETEDEGRRRGAIELAAAEAWAESEGIEFEWEFDQETSYTDYEDESPDTVYECALARDADRDVLASLCGIGDATDEYRRVVNAELAMEAMERVESENEAARKFAERTNRKRRLATLTLNKDESDNLRQFAGQELARMVLEDV